MLDRLGTGKSYIATYVAIEKLLKKEISKIILTRPIVEAGEKMGFLPGTFEEKIAPYLRPLLDSLEAHVGVVKAKELIEEGVIEFAPLAFMRGRSLRDCFVILDESQNTTKEQMKMFLTRIGENCTMVVDGDLHQSDLPRGETNGLQWVYQNLKNVDDKITIIEFSKKEIVRHPLIEKMLRALEGDCIKKSHNNVDKISRDDIITKDHQAIVSDEFVKNNYGDSASCIDSADEKPGFIQQTLSSIFNKKV